MESIYDKYEKVNREFFRHVHCKSGGSYYQRCYANYIEVFDTTPIKTFVVENGIFMGEKVLLELLTGAVITCMNFNETPQEALDRALEEAEIDSEKAVAYVKDLIEKNGVSPRFSEKELKNGKKTKKN